MKLKTLHLNLIFIATVFMFIACSSDNDEEYLKLKYNENAKITIKEVKANSILVEFDGEILNSQSWYIFREKGTTEFTKITAGYHPLKAIELSPATAYEMTVIIDKLEGYPFEFIEFSTPAFDYVTEFNSITSNFAVYSEKGFHHVLETDNPNIPDNLKLNLVNIEDESKSFEVKDLNIDGNIVSFTIPDEAVKDEPYEYAHQYFLQYKVDENVHSVKGYFNREENYKFYVQNTNPYITSVNRFEGNFEESTSFELNFNGYLMSQFEEVESYFETSIAIITRLDDGSQIIIEENEEGPAQYFRFWNSIAEPINFYNLFHTCRTIRIIHPRIDTEEV